MYPHSSRIIFKHFSSNKNMFQISNRYINCTSIMGDAEGRSTSTFIKYFTNPFQFLLNGTPATEWSETYFYTLIFIIYRTNRKIIVVHFVIRAKLILICYWLFIIGLQPVNKYNYIQTKYLNFWAHLYILTIIC